MTAAASKQPGTRSLDQRRRDLVPAQAVALEYHVEPGTAADWRRVFGRLWFVDLLLFGAMIVVAGTMTPLSDPDLPQHLANGEWIVTHGTWPVLEPFAWTRLGEPYYAYSHLPQVLYYSALSWFGPLGLRLLNGVILCGAGAAVLVLGRFAGWRPWVTITVAAYNVLIGVILVPALRPQALLLVAVPLCWAMAYAVLRQRRIAAPMLGLALSSSLAANVHLFFPVTAAPLALCLVRWPRQSWRVFAVSLPIVIGWLLSPYGFRWHEVFALNFGANPLLIAPSPITEFRPGFTRLSFAVMLLVPLMLLPWGVPPRTARREKLLLAAMWLVGLVAFGYAVRLVLLWWLISIPLAALVVGHALRNVRVAPPRNAVRAAAYAIILLLLVPIAVGAAEHRIEGDVTSRRLPSIAHAPTNPLVEWLECTAQPGSAGRVFTWFNYGSYLTWRMPGYSMSIDGRTIFPDSVAEAEVLISAMRTPSTMGPWASADLAIVPETFRVAAVLDTASGWQRAATNRREGGLGSIGLWVREAWWEQVATVPLPELPVEVSESAPSRGSRAGACAWTS